MAEKKKIGFVSLDEDTLNGAINIYGQAGIEVKPFNTREIPDLIKLERQILRARLPLIIVELDALADFPESRTGLELASDLRLASPTTILLIRAVEKHRRKIESAGFEQLLKIDEHATQRILDRLNQ